MATTPVTVPETATDPDAYGPPSPSAWQEIDWREHLRWADVAGAPVNYVDVGEGDPLVLIHGLSGSWTNWLENIPHFAATHRVIAMDLPGFGASPMPREKISINGYAAAVDELLDGLGIDCAAVIGNSMGGFVGAELAIEFATRVERLVLVSAAGITSQELRSDTLLAGLRRLENVLTAATGWMATRSEAVVRRPGLRRHALGIVAAHPTRIPPPLAFEMARGSGKPGFVGALDALTDYPLEDRLARIECPTLVVWGDRDRLVPLRDADRFVAAIGDNARKLVYEDTGHMAMLERPARFHADADAFLAGDAPEPPQ